MVWPGNECSSRSGKLFPLWPEFKDKTLPTWRKLSHFPSLIRVQKRGKPAHSVRTLCFRSFPSGLEPPLHIRINHAPLRKKPATLQAIEAPARPPASIEARIQTAISRIAQSDCPVLVVGEY